MIPVPPTGEEFSSTRWQNWFFSVYQALRPTATRQASVMQTRTLVADESIQAANLYRPVKSVSANYVMAPNDCIIFADASGGDIDVTLPPASGGRAGFSSRRTIKRVDGTANVVNVLVRTTDELDNGVAVTIAADQGKDFDCDGSTKWYTVGAT